MNFHGMMGNWFFIYNNFPSLLMTSLQNSIRHNLSLHNRFMRVQNEGTGKSSWWMLNPDAKPGKSVRRRAASMETSKFEKRRGRVKKRVEQMRNGMITSKYFTARSFRHFNVSCRFFFERRHGSVERCQFIAGKQRKWRIRSLPRESFA